MAGSGAWKAVGGVVLALVLLIAGVNWAVGQSQQRAVEDAVGRFYRALAGQDWEAAGRLATVPLQQRMQRERTRREPLRAAPPTVDVTEVVVRGDLARARVRVDTQLASGRWDVLWHRVELVRGEAGWVIARVEISRPVPTRSGTSVPPDFSPAAFARYLAAVAAGDWEAAEKELAGPALAAHEASRAVLGPVNAGLFETYGPPAFTHLSASPDLVTVRADYAVDERPVSMRVTFYRTGERWRVVDVLNISR